VRKGILKQSAGPVHPGEQQPHRAALPAPARAPAGSRAAQSVLAVPEPCGR